MDDDDDNDMNQKKLLIILGGTTIWNLQKGYSSLSANSMLERK
ncbi:Uncharacterised protein [Niallia circulans]|nr:Uncharacterised protein [Niallia circulans]